ncbi:MAG: sodium:solute symporter [bacterium]
MRSLDWIVLISSLVFIVAYGLWKGRGSKDIDGYLLANRRLRWHTIALSIMATQASAITFLSTPGQAYVDGMRFVQFYFGLPIAMVILSITAVPIYHKLKVFTAYEYLEGRFDLKTRGLAALLFLIQRGLAAGLTIYAPALILSVILGWNIYITNLIIGSLVIIYTASGGTKAVSWTHFYQMLIAMFGMFVAFFVILNLLPRDISLIDAASVAGKMGRLNAIDFSFDLNNRYTIWSGILAGLFLQLSYFGTDQSQVQRYLTGRSITESRFGLLFNGLAKIPMQFFILFVGAMLFVFYQFEKPPIFFNSVERERVENSAYAGEYAALQIEYDDAFEQKKVKLNELIAAMDSGSESDIAAAEQNLDLADQKTRDVRANAIEIMQKNDPDMDPSDTNYVFLTFVTTFLPVGLVGLVIAAIFAASMSSTSAELNALASTTVVDIYRRTIKKEASDRHYLIAAKVFTVLWGVYAVFLAEYASRLGSLIEAVNILGSLFYGTILGIFLVAFYFKKVRGTATFFAAIVAEIIVLLFHFFELTSYMWYNVVGCLAVIFVSYIINQLLPDNKNSN